VLATMSLVGFVALWMAGRLTGGQAVGASLATIVGSMLSGASAYGSGVNVGLGRSVSSWLPRSRSALPTPLLISANPQPPRREPTTALQLRARSLPRMPGRG
jgi:hypothetical protein